MLPILGAGLSCSISLSYCSRVVYKDHFATVRHSFGNTHPFLFRLWNPGHKGGTRNAPGEQQLTPLPKESPKIMRSCKLRVRIRIIICIEHSYS